MTDVFDKKQRSELMSRVGQKDTAPEMLVRRLLHRKGYRYRLHVRSLPGTPDIVFPARRKVIFVHGCFWHGHPGCRRAALPETRNEFWSNKIKRNQERDRGVVEALRDQGWDVLIVWQCEIGPKSRLEADLISFLGPAGGAVAKRR